MKIRVLALILTVVMMSVVLTSCEGLRLFNNIWEALFPSEGGDTNNFWLQIIFPDFNRCKTHTIVPLETIDPTCTSPGAVGGQVCQKCGEVIVEQTVLPLLGHEFSGNKDETCNRCPYTRDVACGHDVKETLPAVEPTCTSTGRSEGERCISCEEIVSGYEIIQMLPHTYDNPSDQTCNYCDHVRVVECLHINTKEIKAVEPTCTEEGFTRGAACAACGKVLVKPEKIDKIPHTESDWIVDVAPTETEKGAMHTQCTVCGFIINSLEMDVINPDADANASKGLFFYLNEDKKSYSLISIGDCTDTDIVVPSCYNGLPVTKIENSAFFEQSHITSIVIPKGVYTVGSGAFRGCTSLVSVTLPSTVTTIKEYAFYGCENLSEINLPKGIASIENSTFFGCVSLENIELPQSLETIGVQSFCYTGIKTVVIPSSVKSIGANAFCLAHLENGEYVKSNERTEITVFVGLSKIGAYSFSKNTTVYFKGTAKEWNDILINPMNYNYKVVCSDKTFTH